MVRLEILKRGWFLLGLLTMGPVLAQAGGLTFVESQQSGLELSGASAVAISPDNKYLYVTGDGGNHGALSVWKRDLITGSIDFVEALFTDTYPDLEDVRSVAVSPVGTGTHVYAVTHDKKVVVFTRDAALGTLTLLEAHEEGVGLVPAHALGKLFAVALDKDGEHVYVASQDPPLIAVFKRETTAGPNFGKLITFVEIQTERPNQGINSCSVDDACHLRNPEALTLSPDGVFLYVAAKFRGQDKIGSVVVFKREITAGPNFGKLTFIESILGGAGGLRQFVGLRSLVVSPELGVGGDKHLYVASSKGLFVFDRDSVAGTLTFAEHQSKFKGAGDAWSVGIDPTEGRYVYVSGNGDNAIGVFRRDATPTSPTFGKLAFIETQFDGIPSALRLDEPRGLVVAPDGNHVYAASFASPGALTAFAIDKCGDNNRGVDEECDDDDIIPGDGCDELCRIELCDPTPLMPVLCRTPPSEESSLLIKNDPLQPDSKDSLQWKWKKGQATSIANYGDPTATATYAICIYDGSGLLMSRAALAGGTCAKGKACWKKKINTETLATTRYTYKDTLQTPSGLTDVQLTPGTNLDLKALVKFKGKGSLLQPPTLSSLTFPVTVQVMNTETSVCWQATFSNTNGEATNDGTKFKAKSD